VPLFPGFDTLGTLEYIMKTGYDHTWFVLTQRIIARELVLSGSDQNPDLTGKNIIMLLKHALTGASAQIEGFKRDGIDFVVERNLRDLVDGMNRITDEPLIDLASLQREIEARDREIANPFTKDSQITAIRGSRKYLGDKLARTVKPHRLLDPKAGPLIAVRLNVVTRKTLGGRGNRPSGACTPGQSRAATWPLCGWRGGGIRRRWRSRLQSLGRHIPGRLPVQWSGGRTCSGGGSSLVVRHLIPVKMQEPGRGSYSSSGKRNERRAFRSRHALLLTTGRSIPCRF